MIGYLARQGTVHLAPSRARERGGLALVATLLVLAVVGVLVAAATRATLSSVRASALDYQEARAFYAAEAGGEAALSQVMVALLDGYLSDEELQAIRPPKLDGFSFDDFGVEKIGESAVETITDGPYSGLYALTQNVDIRSQAEDRVGTVSGVVLRAKAQAIPIFQFGVFYEGDLEGSNYPPMEFAGRIHANGNVYLCSPNAYYREMVTTPRKVVLNRKAYDDNCSGVYIDDAAAVEVRLDFDSRDTPDPDAFKSKSTDYFDARLQTDAFDVNELAIPLPAGMDFYEVIRPQDAGDSEAEKRAKYSWKADLTIDPPVNQLVANPVCDVVPAAKAAIPQCDAALQFSWEAFYDAREGYYVDVLDIDVSKLPADIRIVYIHFNPTFTGTDDFSDGVHPVVRVRNAATLPGPLSVATDRPLYVQGDFNAFNKQPASLVGDALTILSNAWVDERHVCTLPDASAPYGCAGWGATQTGQYRSVATQTNVNAAILAGSVPTPCDWAEPGCVADGSKKYHENWFSGGLENFPRFLENWSGVTFTYKGSMANVFGSRVARGPWNLVYYNPPKREWSFDTDFRDPAQLPPGTPVVGNVVRSAMRNAF